MAEKKLEKKYKVKIETNPDFCGKGAGGIHFAHGEAILPECRMIEWFREHAGYAVEETNEGK